MSAKIKKHASEQHELAWIKRWSKNFKPVKTSVLDIYFKKTEIDWFQFSYCLGLHQVQAFVSVGAGVPLHSCLLLS